MHLSELMTYPVKASAPGLFRAERHRFKPVLYSILFISTLCTNQACYTDLSNNSFLRLIEFVHK